MCTSIYVARECILTIHENIMLSTVMHTFIFSIRWLYSESLAAPCGVICRLHAESFAGSMWSHLPAPCGVICRPHAESFAGSMWSHLPAPYGVICQLSSSGPSRAIILVARIGAPMEWHCPIQRHQLVQVPQPSALH